jgi:ribosomal protein L11 methylase PrmA
MQSLGDIFHFAVVQGYPWKKLGQRTIVDVGGGQGNLSIALVEMYAHKFNTFNLSNWKTVRNFRTENTQVQRVRKLEDLRTQEQK